MPWMFVTLANMCCLSIESDLVPECLTTNLKWVKLMTLVLTFQGYMESIDLFKDSVILEAW